MGVEYNLYSPEITTELHRRGITAWTWTVDEPVFAEVLLRWGIDSITTNRPDIIINSRDRLTLTDGKLDKLLVPYSE